MKKWITKHGIEVTRLDGFRCFCYVIETESEKWLIDTSTLSDKKRIQKQMEKGCIDTLNGIILTHAHISHVEAASFYSEKFQCPIYIHDSELHFVQTGDCFLPKAVNPAIGFVESIVSFIPFMNKYPACRDAQPIPFEEPLIWNEYIRFIETPGHSEGGISIVIDGEVAIVGDIMRKYGKGRVKLAWANQPGLVRVSWKKLWKTGCKQFLPSHGGEIERTLLEKAMEGKK